MRSRSPSTMRSGMLAHVIRTGARTANEIRAALTSTDYAGVAMSYRSNGKGDMAHSAVIVCYDGASRQAQIAARYSMPPTN